MNVKECETLRWAAAAILAIALLATPAHSQGVTASIVGTITDATGAVLPGVTVVATNEGTGLRREIFTNESGNYTIPLLPVGTYAVATELPGFRSEVRTGITLNVDARARIDFALQVGQLTETIEVTSEAPLVQTEDSSVGFVVDQRKVTELPLNGRRFEQLVNLVPGATMSVEGSLNANRGLFNVVGQREVTSSFILDGVDNIDPVVRIYAYRPSIDLIQEFKVQTSAYAAEFGRNSGAVVNVTTKSGTNAVHGAVWEFYRGSALNAKNYFDPADKDIPRQVKNQFGAAVGGPIRQDKTFFFVLYEGLRSREAQTRVGSVPPLAWRQGDFSALSQQIMDPVTGQPFPGNIIPQDRFNSNSRAILDYTKADGKPSFPVPNLRLNEPNSSVNNYVGNPVTEDDINDISVKIDHQFNDNWRASGRGSYTANPIFDPYGDQISSNPSRRIDGYPTSSNQYRTNIGLNLTWTASQNTIVELRAGYSRLNQPFKPLELGPDELRAFETRRVSFNPIQIQGLHEIGRGGGFDRAVNTYNYLGNVTQIKGNHTFKYGVDVRRYLFNAGVGGASAFQYRSVSRTGQTGFAFADFLLGLPDSTNVSRGDVQGHPRKFETAIYIQDDWKATPNLTINWGLRYEFYKRMTEEADRFSSFDPETRKVRIAGEGGEGRSLVNGDHNNFAPRLGFAYRPFGGSQTVIKGGTGVFYDNDERHNFSIIVNYPRFTFLSFDDKLFPLEFTPEGAFPDGAARVASVISLNGVNRDFRDTYSIQYNFGIQHELVSGLLIDTSYVGSKTNKLKRQRRLNQPQLINGVVGPRPYPAFGRLRTSEWTGNSNFHSLQARVEKRFADGLTFISSYTWGKSIDNTGGQGRGSSSTPQDSYNLAAERGLSDFDVRHVYRFSWVAELPFGRGQRFGSDIPDAANFILGGWEFSGILTAQSGFPLTPRLAGDNSGVLIRGDRPHLVGNPKRANPDPIQWINKAAYAMPDRFTFGNSARGTATSDGIQTLDLTLAKAFDVAEDSRIQFRAEFFNALNHPNFGFPNLTWNSSNFGAVGRTSTINRQIQLALRFEF